MNEVPSEGVITVLLLTISLGIALTTVCNLYWALREEAPMTVEPVFPVRTGVARRTFAVRMANPTRRRHRLLVTASATCSAYRFTRLAGLTSSVENCNSVRREPLPTTVQVTELVDRKMH